MRLTSGSVLALMGLLAGCSQVQTVQVTPGADCPSVEYAPGQFAKVATDFEYETAPHKSVRLLPNAKEGIFVELRGVGGPDMVGVVIAAEHKDKTYLCEKILRLRECGLPTTTAPSDTRLGSSPYASRNQEVSEGVELWRNDIAAEVGSYRRIYLIRWVGVSRGLTGSPAKISVMIRAYRPQPPGAKFELSAGK